MDTALVRQFLDFFQDYLSLSQLRNWPENDTTEAEIRNAFIIAQHIEKCLDKLQKNCILNEFLSTLNSSQDVSNVFLKTCLSDPPKYVLKKVILSNSKIDQMDVALQVFISLYSKDKLEECLADIMVESASKETLLKNMPTQLPRDVIMRFKSQLLLSELNLSENCDNVLVDMLNNCTGETMEFLVVSLLNKDHKYYKSVKYVVDSFLNIMSSKNQSCQRFWKLLLNVNDSYLVQMCVENLNLFKLLSKAVLDCSKLLREHMSAEFFYINLNYSELVRIMKNILGNQELKTEFYYLVSKSDSDVEFWENMIK